MAAMDENSHPMDQLKCALSAAAHLCAFPTKSGTVSSDEYWKLIFDDLLTVLALMPIIMAAVFGRAPTALRAVDLDYGGVLAASLDSDSDALIDFIRQYVVLHMDHTGGKASTLAARVAASAHCNAFGSLDAGMSALSGPRHGRANQDALEFIEMLIAKVGDSPTDDTLIEIIQKLHAEKFKFPGFGHRVYRLEDSRATIERQYGETLCPSFGPFFVANRLSILVPPIINAGKDPLKDTVNHANVDLFSGSLTKYFRISPKYFTPMFGFGRVQGILIQILFDFALELPIIRPDSLTMDQIASRAGIAFVE